MARKEPSTNGTAHKGKSAEEFVRIWQDSKTVEEVCQRTGLSFGGVNSRSNNYRRKGVRLKKFPRVRNCINVDALNAIIDGTSEE